MIHLIDKGGPLVYLLLGCSLLAVAIFLERIFHFHRATINVGEFLQGLANLIKRKKYAEALHECAATPGPVARVIHSAIIRHEAPRSELKEIVQEAGQLEVPRLERYLAILFTVAYVAPLIGLLGTVIGLVDTFGEVSGRSGFATATDVSSGIHTALITSAVGLAVAVPSFILYSYLVTSSRTLMHAMERGGIEIVNIITDARADSEIISFDAAASREHSKSEKSAKENQAPESKDRSSGGSKV